MASAKDKENDIVFLPLGGVGEIGMNLGLYGFGPEGNRKWLIVDCGVSFAGPELPGIDLVMPDIKFLEDEVNNIVGMVITHAHEDHVGQAATFCCHRGCSMAELLNDLARGQVAV